MDFLLNSSSGQESGADEPLREDWGEVKNSLPQFSRIAGSVAIDFFLDDQFKRKRITTLGLHAY